MKLSRRNVLLASLGLTQVALLDRMNLRSALAGPSPQGGPTKLVTIWLAGGCGWEHLFTPMSGAGIDKFIVAPDGGNHPFGYDRSMVRNFDGTMADLGGTSPTRKLRGPVFWDDANPGDTTGANPLSGGTQVYRPWGYSWVDPKFKLYDRACLLVGANQGTAAHESGQVASFCGVAGTNFRSPAIAAYVASYMSAFFPDRPIPNAHVGPGPSPIALTLPSTFSPYALDSMTMLESTISDRRDSAWKGLRARTQVPAVNFDGTPGTGTMPLTALDEAVLKAIRAKRGHSTSGTDALYQSLYDTNVTVSKTIARDVLSVLAATKGFEIMPKDPLYGTGPLSTACIGSADTCGDVRSMAPYDFVLQLLKSDLVTSVSMRATSIVNTSFDMHSSGGARSQTSHLRIALEGIGQFLNEMALTKAPSGKGSLLDETLVYVCSDFGRTFARSGGSGLDHHPATCAILVGGNVRGNQMLGGYDETAPVGTSPLGVAVPIVEETGSKSTRTPNSQDVAATVLRAFGMQPGKDFFIPGGYGVFDGALQNA